MSRPQTACSFGTRRADRWRLHVSPVPALALVSCRVGRLVSPSTRRPAWLAAKTVWSTSMTRDRRSWVAFCQAHRFSTSGALGHRLGRFTTWFKSIGVSHEQSRHRCPRYWSDVEPVLVYRQAMRRDPSAQRHRLPNRRLGRVRRSRNWLALTRLSRQVHARNALRVAVSAG